MKVHAVHRHVSTWPVVSLADSQCSPFLIDAPYFGGLNDPDLDRHPSIYLHLVCPDVLRQFITSNSRLSIFRRFCLCLCPGFFLDSCFVAVPILGKACP